MARTPDVLEDPTPIDSPTVDIGIRVAWLLRMRRSAGAGGRPVSVTEMAALLRDQGVAATPPSVSGWETGRVTPSTAVVEAYERALGADPGTLRGAIDIVRRTFGRANRPAYPAPPDLPEVDRAVAPVLTGAPVTGADWLHFCDAAIAVRPGLPTHLMRPLVDRLVSEVARAVFTAYVTRYEALALLRCGQYAGMVLEALSDHVAEPGNMLVAEAMSLVVERPDPAAVELLASYLDTDDAVRLRGAVIGIETLYVAGRMTPAYWATLREPFLRAYEAGADDQELWTAFSTLWHLMPPALREEAAPRLRRPARTDPAGDSGRDPALEQEFARDVSDRVCAARGLVPQPLLTRLIHEATFEERWPRRFAAAVLLMASPLHGELATQVAAGTPTVDSRLREAAAELLIAVGDHRAVSHARRWVDSGDASLIGPGLIALAHVGEPLPQPELALLLDRPGSVGRRALYHAGMTGHPELARLAADAAHPLATGARWWLRHGSAVTG